MQRQSFIFGCTAAAAAGVSPRPASSEDAAFNLDTPTGSLFGTLSLPEQIKPLPVALIVAGSGPTDRDGNAPSLHLNTYSKLASALASNGIATVRYDKRGIGASRVSTPEADLRFETYANDAALWIAKLRADGRFSRVTLIGHSEGSLLGMLAAKRAPVDAFVSLEGAGFPIATVLRAQLQPKLAPYPQLAAAAESILTRLSRGETVPATDVPAELMALYRPSVQPYVISWLKYDPRVEIAGVTGRVTIVQGTHDVQAPVEDGRALSSAIPSARYVVIDGMTHVLTDDPGTTLEQQLPGAYSDAARPLDATLVRTLVSASR